MVESFDLVVLAAAAWLFALGVLRRASRWRVGVPAPLEGPLGERVQLWLRDAVAHVRILRDRRPGLMHLAIFLGVLLPLGLALLDLVGVGAPRFLAFPAALLVDLAGVAALAALGYALWRRVVTRPDRLDNRPEDFFVLALLLAVILTGLATSAAGSARAGDALLPKPAAWLAARPLTLLGAGALADAHPWIWRIHFFLVMGFAAAVPYCRLFHLFSSPLNVLCRNTGPRGRATLPDLENEDADHFGASRIEHLTWKDILDLDACTRCGRCQDGCPAHLTEKPLSPKKAVQDMKRHWVARADEILRLRGLGEDPPEEETSVLVDEAVTRDVLWSCTTCRYCEEHCPVCIEPVSKLLEFRRHLVLMESDFPPELKPTFKNLENNSNPWGVGFSTRADWAEGLDVPLLEEGAEEVEVLYWVGCAGSFDDRQKRISMDMVRIFRAAGVSFGILGPEEACCGDPARRAGNEYLYQMQAQQNVETLKGRKFRRIVTPCPHCLHVLGTEYPQLGGTFETASHVAFVLELLKTGRLALAAGGDARRCVIHDSCYLGRYRGLYEEPRALLALVNGGQAPLEADRCRDKSFCCGAGGGRMWMEELLGTRINTARYEQLAARDPEVVVTACPYCLTMMDDAVKDKGHEEKVKALDLAELVAARLPAEAPPEGA